MLSALLTLAVAQLSSYLVNTRLAIGETYVVSPFIYLTHVRNTGGIFGSFEGHSTVFALLSGSLVIAVSVYLLKTKTVDLFDSVCIGLPIGAGASNILDRLIYGSVVDFIDIRGIPHWNYIFNTADTMIHVGIWSLVIRHLFWRKHPHPKPTLG